MIEIKEGIDLDRAIAGVIGLICTQRVLGSDIEFYVDPRDGTDTVPRTFKPSTDLNDAFHAAECAGLFGDSGIIRNAVDSTEWVYEDKDREVYVRAKTVALAICAAILKVRQ